MCEVKNTIIRALGFFTHPAVRVCSHLTQCGLTRLRLLMHQPAQAEFKASVSGPVPAALCYPPYPASLLLTYVLSKDDNFDIFQNSLLFL